VPAVVTYTVLRVAAGGVLLDAEHRRRLGVGADEPWPSFPGPGVYAVGRAAGRWEVAARGGSRLHDGMPARLRLSPVAALAGAIAKPAPPCAYDVVRVAGVATLLTSADGGELLEACSASVLAWDGAGLVCVCGDRPRVWSTAEAAIRARLPVREVVIPADSDALLLVNAVKGTCRLAGRSRGFPGVAERELAAILAG
jgi:hypothetical protein